MNALLLNLLAIDGTAPVGPLPGKDQDSPAGTGGPDFLTILEELFGETLCAGNAPDLTSLSDPDSGGSSGTEDVGPQKGPNGDPTNVRDIMLADMVKVIQSFSSQEALQALYSEALNGKEKDADESSLFPGKPSSGKDSGVIAYMGSESSAPEGPGSCSDATDNPAADPKAAKEIVSAFIESLSRSYDTHQTGKKPIQTATEETSEDTVSTENMVNFVLQGTTQVHAGWVAGNSAPEGGTGGRNVMPPEIAKVGPNRITTEISTEPWVIMRTLSGSIPKEKSGLSPDDADKSAAVPVTPKDVVSPFIEVLDRSFQGKDKGNERPNGTAGGADAQYHGRQGKTEKINGLDLGADAKASPDSRHNTEQKDYFSPLLTKGEKVTGDADSDDKGLSLVEKEGVKDTPESDRYGAQYRNDLAKATVAQDQDGTKVAEKGSFLGLITEKIEKVIEQSNNRSASTDMVVRLKIDEKNSLLVGLKEDGQKITVEVKTGNEQMMNFLTANKEAITRQLESRNIYTTILLSHEGYEGFERRDKRQSRENAPQEQPEEGQGFDVLFDALA
jgi:hypothetical protein